MKFINKLMESFKLDNDKDVVDSGDGLCEYIHDYLLTTVPARAVVEITKLVEYSKIEPLSVKFNRVTVKDISKNPRLINELLPEGKDYGFTLDYDVKGFRRTINRVYNTDNILTFRCEDGRIIMIKIEAEMDVYNASQDTDEAAFSMMYTYVADILTTLNIVDVTGYYFELPANYIGIDTQYKNFYEGYIEHKELDLLANKLERDRVRREWMRQNYDNR
jgi:hypothetical protein